MLTCSGTNTSILAIVGADLLSLFRTIPETCGTKAVGLCRAIARQQVSRVSDEVMALR